MRQARNLHSIMLIILYSCISFASAPDDTTFQTKIIAPSGLGLEASAVDFRFTILATVGLSIQLILDFSGCSRGQHKLLYQLGDGV